MLDKSTDRLMSPCNTRRAEIRANLWPWRLSWVHPRRRSGTAWSRPAQRHSCSGHRPASQDNSDTCTCDSEDDLHPRTSATALPTLSLASPVPTVHLKVKHFKVSGKTIRHCMKPHEIGFDSKGSEDMTTEMTKKVAGNYEDEYAVLLGWLTVCRQVNHIGLYTVYIYIVLYTDILSVYNQSTRSTQPSIHAG